MEKRSKRIVKYLSIIWVITYVLLAFILQIYTIHSAVVKEISPLYPNSPLHLVVLALSIFFFYPMLFIIRHHAQIAESKKAVTVTTIGIVFFTCWLAVNILCSLVYLLT